MPRGVYNRKGKRSGITLIPLLEDKRESTVKQHTRVSPRTRKSVIEYRIALISIRSHLNAIEQILKALEE